jgi:hypothetical protein
MTAVIAISIIFSSAIVFLTGLCPAIAGNPDKCDRTERVCVAVVACGLACLSSFLNVFSVVGVHVTGVAALLLAAVATERWLRTLDRGNSIRVDAGATCLMLATHLLAVYAHYTNVFLVAPATVIALLTFPGRTAGERISLAIKYSAFAFILFLPGLLLMVVQVSGLALPVGEQGFVGFTVDYLLNAANDAGDTPGERAVQWFVDMARYVSWPGLLLGVAGVVWTATTARARFPAAVLLAHFGFGVIMPGFGQYDRTAAYAIPFLAVGIAWLAVASVLCAARPSKNAKRFAGGALVLLAVAGSVVAHVVWEVERLARPAEVHRWGNYVRDQGKWRPIIAEIDAEVPAGATLIPWDYLLSHQYVSMTSRPLRDVRVFRPLDTLLGAARANELGSYMSRRALSISSERPGYVLVPPTPEGMEGIEGFGRLMAEAALLGIPGTTLELIASWEIPRQHYVSGSLRFYRIHWPGTSK